MNHSGAKTYCRQQWPYNKFWNIKKKQENEITSTTDIIEEMLQKKENKELNKEKENGHIEEKSISGNEENIENKGEQDEEQSDQDKANVPDHWTDELITIIPDTCPINYLLNAISASTDISSTQQAEDVQSAIFPMVEGTLKDLRSRHKIFEDSYVLPVGSMAEHTQVNRAKPDEFDFAIILPMLADERYLDVFCNKNANIRIQSPSMLSLMNELISGDPKETFCHFQQVMRKLWSNCMRNNIPEGWRICNPSGHSDDRSVAATFHLERRSDKITVDLDVCFWVPLDVDGLSKVLRKHLPLDNYFLNYYLNYLLNHCLDSKGIIYAVLPEDINIHYLIRFAMPTLEKETLQKYGPENGRLQCYRLSKCIVASLLPKVRKSEDCSMCSHDIVSSYCLKNIVLYMVAYYKDDLHWTAEKIPIRIFEVFHILTRCVKENDGDILTYFNLDMLDIDMNMAYNPDRKRVENRCDVCESFEESRATENTDYLDETKKFDQSEDSKENGKNGETKDSVTHGKGKESCTNIENDAIEESKEGIAEDKSYRREHIQCILPNFDILKEKIEDRPSSQALRDYEDFLNNSKWRYPDVLCRLSELLTVLVCPDEEDREKMVRESGWNCLDLPTCLCIRSWLN